MNADDSILIVKALDGLSARAVVTSENIANASTPGYRPLRVSFEDALKDAAVRGAQAVQSTSAVVTRGKLGTVDAENRPDLEVATAASTSLRYSALIEVLSRQIQMESTAITGNN